MASSIFIGILSLLLFLVFNLPTFVFIQDDTSLECDSRLTTTYQMHFPNLAYQMQFPNTAYDMYSSGQSVDQSYDVEVINNKNQHSKEFEVEALNAMEAALEMLKQSKVDRAQKLYEHALALCPNHPEILTNYGEFLENIHNDIIHADHFYFKALANSPGHTKAIRNHDRIAELVEEMDLTTLRRIAKKKHSFTSLPVNSSLKKTKLELYFQHIYHTLGIEGNTMTLSQTRAVVETKTAIGGKSIIEHNEILGLDAALKFINTTLINRVGHISVNDILELHRRVLGFVEPLEAGKLRRTQVFVGGHIPPAPSNIPPLLEKFERWLNSWEAMRLHPVKYAALAHYKLVHLHPFTDGNGRTSRLLMDTILMHAGYPPALILQQDRHRYYRMIEHANEGDIRPFVRYIAEYTERTLDLFIWSSSEFSSELPALASEMTHSNYHRHHHRHQSIDDKFIKGNV